MPLRGGACQRCHPYLGQISKQNLCPTLAITLCQACH
ncbi:hypothetical protein [Candidatus Magnetaquicoccus inordinatus]